MKKFKFIAFIAVLAAFFLGVSVKASASSPSLSVNDLYTTSNSVTGTASKGVSIIVRNSNKKTIASTTADSQSGQFSADLHTSLKANQKVYVYARRSAMEYFYRILTVKSPATSTTATTSNSKASSTAANTASTATSGSKLTINEPTGKWYSGNNNGYRIAMTFRQSTGLNQALYKNGKLVKKLITNASYKVTTYSKAFWGITYRERGSKTYQKFYLRFTDNTHFILVNKANKAVKVKFGVAPLHYYKFVLVK